ncbi:MAG: hypothetical protein HY337_07930 [Gemmatimonadetes bacterium]|nr:hypothetical protein [Gemmatimonadota bacterium]
MLNPSALCLVPLGACAILSRLRPSRFGLESAVVIGATGVGTLLSLGNVERYREYGWQGLTQPSVLDRPAVHWGEVNLRSGSSPSVRTEGWLVASLHFTTGASVDRMPDLRHLASDVKRQAGRDMVFLFSERSPAQPFACPRYLAAYHRIVSMVADSVIRGDGYRTYWMRASADRAARLREVVGGRIRIPSCAAARHDPERPD